MLRALSQEKSSLQMRPNTRVSRVTSARPCWAPSNAKSDNEPQKRTYRRPMDCIAGPSGFVGDHTPIRESLSGTSGAIVAGGTGGVGGAGWTGIAAPPFDMDGGGPTEGGGGTSIFCRVCGL